MALTEIPSLEKMLARPILVSLFDYSGCWSEPYRRAGCRVLQVDNKLGFDIFKWNYKAIKPGLVAGIIAAPPCDDFAVSGAQYWHQKDTDGRTAASVRLVKEVLVIVRYFKPRFWVIENPVGRLNQLIPELEHFGPCYWQPFWYGDKWTKKTGLWGQYTLPPPKHKVLPLRYSAQGSWTQRLGGKSERTKELRAVTPPGFAQAFYEANPLGQQLVQETRINKHRVAA
jgi:hypothetical protein